MRSNEKRLSDGIIQDCLEFLSMFDDKKSSYEKRLALAMGNVDIFESTETYFGLVHLDSFEIASMYLDMDFSNSDRSGGK